jgi:HSP20 family protein
MRYRRSSYRYAVVLTSDQISPFPSLRLADPSSPRFAQNFWRPPADVCEAERAFEVIVELAGVDQDEIEIALFEDAVIVEGRRRLSPVTSNGVYHVAEIRQGPFRLELALPAAIDQERVDARYDRGLLRITCPKLASPVSGE